MLEGIFEVGAGFTVVRFAPGMDWLMGVFELMVAAVERKIIDDDELEADGYCFQIAPLSNNVAGEQSPFTAVGKLLAHMIA